MTSEEAILAAVAAEVKGLSRRFDEHAQRTQRDLAEIKDEVKKTNGRVTAIELKDSQADGQSEGTRRVFSAGVQFVLLATAVASSVVAVLALVVVH